MIPGLIHRDEDVDTVTPCNKAAKLLASWRADLLHLFTDSSICPPIPPTFVIHLPFLCLA